MAIALSHSILLGDISSGVSSSVYNPVCPPRVADVGTFSCDGSGVVRETSGAIDEKSFIAEGRSIVLSSASVGPASVITSAFSIVVPSGTVSNIPFPKSLYRARIRDPFLRLDRTFLNLKAFSMPWDTSCSTICLKNLTIVSNFIDQGSLIKILGDRYLA